MAKVAVLGMGSMGTRMAAVLMNAGHEITVWNRSPEKMIPLTEAGAHSARSPREAVQSVDFVICMVRDIEASKHVWLDENDGALLGLSEDVIAIESSTLTVEWIHELDAIFSDRGIPFVDAPVVGTRPHAESANLLYCVGGDTNVVEKATPLLLAMGHSIHHVGSTGSGTAAKLMINALFGIQVAAMGELIGMMEHCGLEKSRLTSIITSTPVCSPAAKAAANAMVEGKFAPMFPIELVEKDFQYVKKMARSGAARTEIIDKTQELFAEAVKENLGDDNITGILKLFSVNGTT